MMDKSEETPIKNLIDFAIEDATLRTDLDKNPVIDKNRLKVVLLEIITKREKRLERVLKSQKIHCLFLWQNVYGCYQKI